MAGKILSNINNWKKGIVIFLFIPSWLLSSGTVQVLAHQLLNFLSGSDLDILNSIVNQEITKNIMVQFGWLFSNVGISYLFWTIILKQGYLKIGLNCSIKNLKYGLAGFIAGAVLIFSLVFVLYATGNIKLIFAGFHGRYFFSYIILFIFVAFNEELISRGFLLGSIIQLSNKFVALVMVAILFSLAHFFNANICLTGKLNIFLAGILLGVPFIYTKSLWFSIGLHFSWNFFLGPLIGSNVSGNVINHSIFIVRFLGNKLMTGGDFGFEGSIVLTGVLIISILILWFLYRIKIPDCN